MKTQEVIDCLEGILFNDESNESFHKDMTKANKFLDMLKNKQLILSDVVKSFFCNNCHSERYRMLTPITYQCRDCESLQAK